MMRWTVASICSLVVGFPLAAALPYQHEPQYFPTMNGTSHDVLNAKVTGNVATSAAAALPVMLATNASEISQLATSSRNSFSSELPTGLPTSLPTGLSAGLVHKRQLPSSLPTSFPTELPTDLPTGLPTSLPAGLPH